MAFPTNNTSLPTDPRKPPSWTNIEEFLSPSSSSHDIDVCADKLKQSGRLLFLAINNVSQFTTTFMDPFLASLEDNMLTKREITTLYETLPSSTTINAVAQLLIKHANRLDALGKMMQDKAFTDLRDSATVQISPDDL